MLCGHLDRHPPRNQIAPTERMGNEWVTSAVPESLIHPLVRVPILGVDELVLLAGAGCSVCLELGAEFACRGTRPITTATHLPRTYDHIAIDWYGQSSKMPFDASATEQAQSCWRFRRQFPLPHQHAVHHASGSDMQMLKFPAISDHQADAGKPIVQAIVRRSEPLQSAAVTSFRPQESRRSTAACDC
jgi:hypothetical protein